MPTTMAGDLERRGCLERVFREGVYRGWLNSGGKRFHHKFGAVVPQYLGGQAGFGKTHVSADIINIFI